MNPDNNKREVYVTPIDLSNETMCISQNHDVNVVHTYHEPLQLSHNQEDQSIGT